MHDTSVSNRGLLQPTCSALESSFNIRFTEVNHTTWASILYEAVAAIAGGGRGGGCCFMYIIKNSRGTVGPQVGDAAVVNLAKHSQRHSGFVSRSPGGRGAV